MSDKSFGDHMSRGIVKNPLLSTAVTGLSIEDLTQNAVLLPVSRTQELFGRQEPEIIPPQEFTPAPSGDATFTPIHPPDQHANKKDDFDVNEYFARLQGTTYVSAPINSHISEANANLETKEGNLEEINLEEVNLNEPNEDIQQSITADIAQNFSQLPTVLPQVASAVFSSFSNMLMKREVTPVREQESVRSEMEVPVGVSERAVAPPPREPMREPPVSAGPGNFRLTTKKKYAQIPGLSSGESAQMPTYTPPTFNQPIFTPPQPDYNQPISEYSDNFAHTDSDIPALNVGQTNVDFSFSSTAQNIPIDTSNRSNVLEAPKKETPLVSTSQLLQDSNQQAGIIPPPPMFSNLAKKDSLPNVGKTILPPSVARRIGSNKPTLTNQAPAFAAVSNIFIPAPIAAEPEHLASQPFFMTQNSLPLTTSLPTGYNSPESSQPGFPPSIPNPPTSIASFNATSVTNVPLPSSTQISSSITVPTANTASTGTPPFQPGTLPPPPKTAFTAPPPKSNTSVPSVTSFKADLTSISSPPQFYNPGNQSQPMAPPPMFPKNQAPSMPPPPSNIAPFSNVASVATTVAALSTPPQMSRSEPSSQIIPPTSAAPEIFNPNQHVSLLSKNIAEEQVAQHLGFSPAAEPPKIPQPPKSTGNTNFRMAKKRPQYYSGPIEGVGAISNNLKPTLEPVGTTAFQGSVFTPESNTVYQAAVFTPENVTENIPPTQGAISSPESNTQQQFYNFTPEAVNEPPNVTNYNAPVSSTYNFNTAFDVSRQPDAYEPPKQESAFGIIGSLKSKLSSIDINKLQNSVTTFFDPGYTAVKTESAELNQPAYGQNQGIEIFVANPDIQAQPYNYDAHQTNFTYGNGSIPNASQYYNQQAHNVYSPSSFFSEPSYGTQSYNQVLPEQQASSQPSNNPTSTPDESAQKPNVWGNHDSSKTSRGDVAHDCHKTMPVIDAEPSQKPFMWTASDPASTGNEEDNVTSSSTQLGTTTVDTEATPKPYIWNAYDPANTDNDKHNVADNRNFNLGLKSAVDTEISLNTNVWESTGNDKNNVVAQNSILPQEPASSINLEASQNSNIWGSFNPTISSGHKGEGVGSSNATHEATPTSSNEATQKANVWMTYDSPSTSYGQYAAAQNSSITQQSTSTVDTKPSQKPNVWGTYNPSSSGYDQDNVEESKTIQSAAAKTSTENVAKAMENLRLRDEVEKREQLRIEEMKEMEKTGVLTCIYNDIESPYLDENREIKKKAVLDYVDMLDNPELPEVPSVYSCSKLDPFMKPAEIDDGVSELGAVSWNSNEEEVDDQSAAERLLALGDSEDDISCAFDGEAKENFDICETYREVNPPEQEDDDLTHQLIKNITSPIQLMNPVEVPLTETNTTEVVTDDFDSINQCAEISLIADETIETLQVQSATELLDENDSTNKAPTYGWLTEAPLPPGQDLVDHDYTLQTNPNELGFFANNNLFFDNLRKYDEMKTELKSQQVKPILLQREMSIPTAPPAEDSDDAKSDETGVLDVLSIEQDASKDFPVFEEYVIEPSETDDKTDSEPKADETKDTFTNRVDKFKKQDEHDDVSDQKDSGSTLVHSNTMMPSYFDTGNYAAETHFKNSLTSPTIARIPPGFEDHYKLGSKDLDQEYTPIKVPDTMTQTKPTSTVSAVVTKIETLTSTVFSNISTFASSPAHIHNPQTEAKLPDFAEVFGSKIEVPNVSGIEETKELSTKVTPVIKDKVQEKKVQLPDPINFFGSSAQEPDTSEGGNRLASYFAAPPKTENTKSFFELSQGQDHYKQNQDNINKPFFELGQSQDHFKENIANIPHDRYIANLNLIKDLTSCQNIEPKKEQIVRTVNYFTVEYDNHKLNFNKGEPSANLHKQKELIKEIVLENEETINNEITIIVNKCKHCCDLNKGSVLTIRESDLDAKQVRFKQAMDTKSSPREEVNMDPGRNRDRSVNLKIEDVASDGDNSEGVAMITENRSTNEYEPVKHHWFYRTDSEDKSTWRGFSTTDSRAIESAFQSPTLNESTLVPTDGGRYDVNVVGRLRIAVYWSHKPTNVRRCSWFYKGTTDARYVPYTEAVAEKLEGEYHHGITTGEWHRRLVLPNNELVVMHGPAVMVHFLQGGGADAFSAPNLFSFGKRVYRNPPKFKVATDQPERIDHLLLLVHGAGEWKCQKDKIQSTTRPRVVRRGHDESEIEDPEPSSIDHLLLLCHGVGSACDMRFRAVEEVVDDFRSTSLQLLQSHYRNSYDNGSVGRVEVLPISWHASLHAGPRGVDRRLARVTLASIPRLRSFTNDTVLDVLFYTSPHYCQVLPISWHASLHAGPRGVDRRLARVTLASIPRLRSFTNDTVLDVLFYTSPHYCQMILDTVCGELNRIYTLFMSRNPGFKGQVSLGGHSLGSVILYDLLCNQPVPRNPVKARVDKTYISGTAANNPTMQYPKLGFEPLALYALGSPIAIFECIRGVESLGADFYLPSCRNFFNIFHPYDPIAYRLEPLVNPQLQHVKPSLIPHHKGRKRMHLELKDTMARVGADLKQKLVESIKNTWSSMWPSAAPPDHQLEKVVEEEIEKEQLEEESSKEEAVQADVTPGEMLGRLNNGRRVDYVLQEAPFEMINEYLFAMSSHVCYWESEDVMLLILREIYDSMGVQPDVTVPQQSMTVERTTIVESERTVASDASTSRVS